MINFVPGSSIEPFRPLDNSWSLHRLTLTVAPPFPVGWSYIMTCRLLKSLLPEICSIKSNFAITVCCIPRVEMPLISFFVAEYRKIFQSEFARSRTKPTVKQKFPI